MEKKIFFSLPKQLLGTKAAIDHKYLTSPSL